MLFSEIECSEAVAEKIQSKHEWSRRRSRRYWRTIPRPAELVKSCTRCPGRADSGRYLVILLHDLGGGVGRPVTAREMGSSERRAHRKR